MDIHNRQTSPEGEKHTYYISVQAGQILRNQGDAAYELMIQADDQEISALEELFEELASMDEAAAFHFAKSPYGTAGDEEINRGSDGILLDIYRHLHACGTAETKRHIESMGLF